MKSAFDHFDFDRSTTIDMEEILPLLDDLGLALKDVVSRWESDQSAMTERLGRLRDSLRDQLKDFNFQVEGEQKGLWNKLRGNKDPGLKLSSEEFDNLSGKLEGIISGLETVISKKDES